jgi:ribose transport system permease protein
MRTELPHTPAEHEATRPSEASPYVGSSAAAAGGLGRRLSFRNVGAVYVLAIICVGASIWLPDTFPTMATVRQVLNSNAVTALAALAILIPLCAGVFDLSFAYTMSLAGVTAAHFVAEGSPVVVAVGLAIAVGLSIGVINAIVVVKLGIDSFIGTLATGSLIQSFITVVTNDNSITDERLAGPFASIGQSTIAEVTAPVFYAIVIALAIWFFLSQTTTGRRMYGVGFNRDAARLAGVRVERLRIGALIVSGGLAAVAGVSLASVLGSGSPTAGTPYLLPAFAASFLGATQFQGRFNVAGTMVAILLLGTGLTALSLGTAPAWAGSMFTGVVLIVALTAAAGAGAVAGPGFVGRLRKLFHLGQRNVAG